LFLYIAFDLKNIVFVTSSNYKITLPNISQLYPFQKIGRNNLYEILINI